jgi:hypothetical protein
MASSFATCFEVIAITSSTMGDGWSIEQTSFGCPFRTGQKMGQASNSAKDNLAPLFRRHGSQIIRTLPAHSIHRWLCSFDRDRSQPPESRSYPLMEAHRAMSEFSQHFGCAWTLMTGRQGSRPVRSVYQGGWHEKAQWVRLQRLRDLELVRYSPSLQPEFVLVRELRLSWACFYLELWVPVSERLAR